MIQRLLLVLVLITVPVVSSAQEGGNKSGTPSKKVVKIESNIPAQALYSKAFTIYPYYFNKRIDPEGKGELLEVEMVFQNETDDPQDLYIFIIACYEKTEKTKSSFEMPVPEKERIRSFVPFPGNIANFQYGDENKGEKPRFVKFPKNPKEGVDPKTGKMFHLKEKLLVRSYHLSPYRRNFYFFNNVTVLVFDSEGKPVFRQEYDLKGKRR